MLEPVQITPRMLLLAVVVAAGATAAGCTSERQPPVAAMVAHSATGDYGYAEEMLAADLYKVAYVSPRLRATGDDDHGLAAEKQRVYELALWRAAQLAKEKGYPAFAVQQESRDVDVTVRRDPVYPVAPPVPYFFGRNCWRCGWPYGYGYWPYGWPYGYGPAYYRTQASGRIKAELTVKMLASPEPEAFDTAATEERLRRSLASASFSPRTGAAY
jgi:hypothetical protein